MFSMFRIGVKLDPYCSFCPDAVIADVEHFFCNCERTKLGWVWTRLKVLRLCQQSFNPKNWNLIAGSAILAWVIHIFHIEVRGPHIFII